MNSAIEWIKARLSEKSTQRSLPMLAISIIAIIYAMLRGEDSTAIVAAGTALYAMMNAATPEA
jgi:hypothetical protein